MKPGEMIRKDRMISSKEIRRILEREEVGRLGTVDENGLPYVVPINFVFHENKIYFHSAPRGHKLQNIKVNPNVCFEVDTLHQIIQNKTCCKFSAYYHSVIAFGRAKLVNEDDEDMEKVKALGMLIKKYSKQDPETHFTRNDFPNLEDVAVIRIDIDILTGKAKKAENI